MVMAHFTQALILVAGASFVWATGEQSSSCSSSGLVQRLGRTMQVSQ